HAYSRREHLSQGTATIIMAGASVAAVWLLVRSTRAAHAAGELDSSTLLALAMGVLGTFPVARAPLSGVLVRRSDSFGQLTAEFPGCYREADRLCLALLVALAVTLILRRIASRRVPIHAAALLALALWAMAHLSSGLHGATLS